MNLFPACTLDIPLFLFFSSAAVKFSHLSIAKQARDIFIGLQSMSGLENSHSSRL
jgi:hypothetical protein